METCGPGSERRLPHQIVKAKGVIRCPGAALRATVAVARRLDVKEFAQCADVDCSDAGRYCSPVLPSAVRRLALEVMGAVGAIAFTRCRSSSPVRCRPRLSTTRRIAVGTVGRGAIAVRVIAAAGIGEPAVGAWLCRAGTPRAGARTLTGSRTGRTSVAEGAERSGVADPRCGATWPAPKRLCSACKFTAPISCAQPRRAPCAARAQVASGSAPAFAAPRRR